MTVCYYLQTSNDKSEDDLMQRMQFNSICYYLYSFIIVFLLYS